MVDRCGNLPHGFIIKEISNTHPVDTLYNVILTQSKSKTWAQFTRPSSEFEDLELGFVS